MYAYIVNSTGKQIVNGQTLIIIDRAWPDTGSESEREQKRKRKRKRKKEKKTDWVVETWVDGESSRRGVWSQ